MVMMIVIRKAKPFLSQSKEIETDYYLYNVILPFPYRSRDLVFWMFVLELDKVRSLKSGHP